MKNCYKVRQVLQGVIVITKCDRKLLQSGTRNAKFGRKWVQSETAISKCDMNYYSVWQVFQRATIITKWDLRRALTSTFIAIGFLQNMAVEDWPTTTFSWLFLYSYVQMVFTAFLMIVRSTLLMKYYLWFCFLI